MARDWLDEIPEALWPTFLAQLPECVLVAEPNGRILFASRTFEGEEPERIVGRSIASLHPALGGTLGEELETVGCEGGTEIRTL